jgi:hypothetical protein
MLVQWYGGSQKECMGTTEYDQVDIKYISNDVHTHKHMIHEVIDVLV